MDLISNWQVFYYFYEASNILFSIKDIIIGLYLSSWYLHTYISSFQIIALFHRAIKCKNWWIEVGRKPCQLKCVISRAQQK